MESILEQDGLQLPSKCYTPISNEYRPDMDVSGELKASGVQYYQEMIGVLHWDVYIGCVNILLELSLLSQHLVMPHEGHLEQIMNIFGYLKIHKKLRLLFDCGDP